ncbi:hypothetical protein BS78_02G309000 [Paspalum vaginatum]|nr:hypothetical protein BS78_02G309000 [Paspalum vaginatum]
MGTETDGGVGADRISGLPDHLLHSILLRLPDTAAAARTSALSRRWRRVWAHLPELSFRDHDGGRPWYSSKAHRRVDAALAEHAGATVTLLEIHLRYWFPADRAAPASLLQFASQRVAGALRLSVRDRCYGAGVELTPCERTTAIALTFHGQPLRFQQRAPAGGEFAALATLRIKKAYVDTGELGDAVSSSRCQRLKELFLKQVTLKGGAHVLSIRSGSLERLEFDVNAADFQARLHVDAPRLKTLLSPRVFSDAHIVPPNLSGTRLRCRTARCRWLTDAWSQVHTSVTGNGSGASSTSRRCAGTARITRPATASARPDAAVISSGWRLPQTLRR